MLLAQQTSDVTFTYLGLATVDWVVLAVYLFGITGLGIWSYRRVKSMDDFFMGGRRFGKVFMMFFAFGAGTSSEQAVSVVAGTFRAGLAGIWYQFLWLWATPFYWILAPLFRRMRAFTTSDFFEHRYNTAAATLYSIYGIGMSIVFIAAGLFGSGKMIQGLTGGEMPYNYAVAAMTIMFVTYGLAGGLGAAIVTDFIQGVLTITLSFLLLPFALDLVGGFAGLHTGAAELAEVRPGMLDLVLSQQVADTMGKPPITMFYVFMLSITALAGIVVQPHIMGVCGAGKTEFEGRFGFTFGNFIKRFCTVAWTFTGLACIVIYLPDNLPKFEAMGNKAATVAMAQAAEEGKPAPTPEELVVIRRQGALTAEKDFADQIFGLAAHDILPTIAPGLIGLLLASLLAAVMSTCDAQMVVSSGLFTENIYKRFFKPGQSQAHYVTVGRIAGLVIVGLALLLQVQFTDVIQALKVIIKTPAAIGISFWLGIVWRRFSTPAVFTSTITALLVWWFLSTEQAANLLAPSFPDLVAELGGTLHVKDAWQMLGYMYTGVVVGILTSLVTRPVDKQKLDKFFRLLRTPARDGEKIEHACELPADSAPPVEGKLINHPDLEIPKPTALGLGGFIVAWILVFLIIQLTQWLAGYGAPVG
jgi:Na+/proline symporter